MTFMIVWSIIATLIGVGLGIIYTQITWGDSGLSWRRPGAYDYISACFVCGVVMLIVGLATVFSVAGFTGGADKDYGHGFVSGTIVSVVDEGYIYKTQEVKLRQGHGEHSEVLKLSSPDMDVRSWMDKCVVLEFSKYWLKDYKRGDSIRYILSVSDCE